MNLSIKELNELIYSLGVTANKGMMCDKEVNTNLLDKLYCELNYKIGLEAIDEEIENEDTIAERREDAKYERAFDLADVNVRIHFVDNEEADEDAYTDYVPNERSENSNGVSQFILDFVEANGNVSYSEMNDMYKAYTRGSNSFSHILKALMIPYKNRPTKRYIKQIARGTYTVLIANPTNWVVVND